MSSFPRYGNPHAGAHCKVDKSIYSQSVLFRDVLHYALPATFSLAARLPNTTSLTGILPFFGSPCVRYTACLWRCLCTSVLSRRESLSSQQQCIMCFHRLSFSVVRSRPTPCATMCVSSNGVRNGCSEAMANATDTVDADRDQPPPSSPTGASDVDNKKEEEEIGVFGRQGLLATPHVKTLLALGCVVQVRERKQKPISVTNSTTGSVC